MSLGLIIEAGVWKGGGRHHGVQIHRTSCRTLRRGCLELHTWGAGNDDSAPPHDSIACIFSEERHVLNMNRSTRFHFPILWHGILPCLLGNGFEHSNNTLVKLEGC